MQKKGEWIKLYPSLLMNKIIVKRIILIILIITNCIVIFCFSAQKGDDSSGLSAKVVDFTVSKVYPDIDKSNDNGLMENLTTVVRKSAHFSIYTCLGILTYTFTGTYNLNIKKRIIYTIAFCLAYACSDEFHQTFVEGRSGEIRDVCIDTSGSFFGALIVMGVQKIKNNIIK